jgi:hypothetical protein
MHVGNFPNDGREAIAFGQQRTLYMGMEKESNDQARVFALTMGADFWQSEEFASAKDAKLKLPEFKQDSNPINGMDYYEINGNGYLLAAARNDDALWIIDTSGHKDPKIVSLSFLAHISPIDTKCGEWERIDNTAIEGVAVDKQTLWLVNEPWKKVYLNNIKCEKNKTNFEKNLSLVVFLAY